MTTKGNFPKAAKSMDKFSWKILFGQFCIS